MRVNKAGSIAIMGFALLVVLGTAHQSMAQDAKTPYPKMVPIDQYLMPDRGAEIALARSAAPESVSRDATILVLGRKGYETAVEGKDWFVCMVDRGWTGPFSWPDFWNPKVRAAVCLNPQAARSILPIAYLRTRMVLAGRSKAGIVSALKSAFENKQLPNLGAMAYMMSKSAYLTDEGDHNGPHLMFYTLVKNSKDWGSGAAGSPVLSSPYWFFSPKQESRVKGLPPILVFWSCLQIGPTERLRASIMRMIRARFGGESGLARQRPSAHHQNRRFGPGGTHASSGERGHGCRHRQERAAANGIRGDVLQQGYAGDSTPHWPPHFIFFYSETDPAIWGANLPGSPVFAVADPPDQLTSFVIAAQHWSDGTEYLPSSPTHVHP